MPTKWTKPTSFQTFLVVLTYISLAVTVIFLRHNPERSTINVLAYAWITTASTGLGALPFFFVSELNRHWLGVANALAGGMMSAASMGLIMEGIEDEKLLATMPGHEGGHGILKVLGGVAAGVVFMLWSKKLLDQHGDLELGNLHGASAQRALLIIGVMTLHSFAEGLVRCRCSFLSQPVPGVPTHLTSVACLLMYDYQAIGVAFGSKSSRSLGFIISSTLVRLGCFSPVQHITCTRYSSTGKAQRVRV